MTGKDLVAERCAAQLLSGPPARSAEDVVSRLLAVQGQDPRGARLAIRARSAGLTAADVDRALTRDRSLLITWLNRGTLHLVTAEDYWWLQLLTTSRVQVAVSKRLSQEGVPPADADKAVALIDAALAADGPLTRAQLAERVAAAGVRTQGQAMVHILYEASLRGLIIRGPMTGRGHAFVLVRDWLGAPPDRFRPGRFDRDVALAELARRFLAGHERPAIVTWPNGPGCRCAMPGAVSPPSRRSCASGTTAWPRWPAARPPTAGVPVFRHRGCSARSTRCCTAG